MLVPYHLSYDCFSYSSAGLPSFIFFFRIDFLGGAANLFISDSLYTLNQNTFNIKYNQDDFSFSSFLSFLSESVCVCVCVFYVYFSKK